VLKVFCVPKRVLLAHGIRVGGKPQQSLTYLSRLEGRLIVTATCSLLYVISEWLEPFLILTRRESIVFVLSWHRGLAAPGLHMLSTLDILARH
jgi:hypothetical protein